MKKKLLGSIIGFMTCAVILSACASQSTDNDGSDDKTEISEETGAAENSDKESDGGNDDKGDDDVPKENEGETKPDDGASSEAEDIIGNWVIVSSNYHSEYKTGEV